MMIYRLISDDGFFWIGSSASKDTEMILVNHKASSEDTNSHKAYRHFKKIWKQVKIEVIGNGDEKEYIMKEQDNTKCLNLYRSDGRKTPAHPKYQAEYWAKNKDKYNSKARQKYAENK